LRGSGSLSRPSLIGLLQQTREGLSNGLGRPFGDDFANYWSGALIAFHGRVAEVYDFAAFHAFEQSVTAQSIQYYLTTPIRPCCCC
jgi:hypothetical protein